MTTPHAAEGQALDPQKHVALEAMQLVWHWSREAVTAALAAAGRPPTLDIQGMLNAAFAVDGPNLTAQVFEVMMANRMAELNATPHILNTQGAAGVALNGQFLLALLSGDWSIIAPKKIAVETPADPAQLSAL